MQGKHTQKKEFNNIPFGLLIYMPVFCWNFMTSPVDVRKQSSSASIGAATCTLIGLPTVFNVPLQVPLCAVAIVAFGTPVFFFCMHLHVMLQ